MNYKPFSKKQLQVLCWWCDESRYKSCDAVICDGAVRSGKTFCMSLSFVAWSFYRFENASFGICSKTIRSLRRNVLSPLKPVLEELGFTVEDKISQNAVEITYHNRKNTFYLFGGKDESSASLIQGMTLSGVFLDEVALMPRSFVEQALARCSVSGSTFWFNCNPEYPQHWFYLEWIKKCKEKNALYIHFTMKDNPSLSKEMIKRYENLYSGAFYERFIKGRWVSVFGAVYPFMEDSEMYCPVPRDHFEEYALSCDYGTVNPASFGLWGKYENVWYRIDEYYFDSRKTGFQKTDMEHYEALKNLVGDRKLVGIAIDPSAASFIELIKRDGKYPVFPAENNVLDGIRRTSSKLKCGEIKICSCCKAAKKEFSLYRWDSRGSSDSPVKENDHAMDDIRYFVTTILSKDNAGFVSLAVKRGK